MGTSVDDSADSLAATAFDGGRHRDAAEERHAHTELRARLFGGEAASQFEERYQLLRRVGAGGAGEVFEGWDQELKRTVAIKLLQPRVQQELDASEARARLRREAQAMAKLAHPNVIAVFDVGECTPEMAELLGHSARGGVFVVMEYVHGPTLREWMAETHAPVREVVRMFLAAGRGLAAAHEHGIVHRDFKPSNVVVGHDGRVRVLDFGLARAIDPGATTPSTAAEDRVTTSDGLADLTASGTVMGTPPYMAPEQHRGAGVEPASDQYAFCVALYEALYGARPFTGADLRALERAKLRGVPEMPASATHAVPHWLYAAVARGLAVEPADRWPSIEALLAALERGQARARWRRVLLGIGAMSLASAGVAVTYALDVRQRTAECERAGASIDEVWNGDARTKLRDALVATGVSYAATTADKVMPWLDAQAQAWQRARSEACLDKDVRELWDEDTLDRSLWCLDERRMELEALVGELVRVDATVVEKAVTAAAGLGSVDACRDAGLLERLPRPPTERREEVRAVRVELSRAAALERAGKYNGGLELTHSARERAIALGWPPLVAAAGEREASLLERQGDYADAERVGAQAYVEAARVGAWDVAASVASRLVFVVGERLARHAEGLAWGGHAEIALAHAGDPEGLREAGRLASLARVHNVAGDYALARTLHERALTTFEQALGPDHPDVAASLNNLANVHYTTGEYAQARTLHERALAIKENALGRDHPSVAASLNNLAAVHLATREYAQALTLYERALAIWEEALGPDHPEFAATLTNLAVVHKATGEYAQARALQERALAIREKALGPDHPDVAAGLNNLANLYHVTGDYAQARTLHQRALAIQEKALGPDHPHVALSLTNLADLHYVTGDYAQARTLYERVLAIQKEALDPDHPDVALSLWGLARVHLATGDENGAERLLEPAITIYDQHDGIQDGELEARFALGKALVATGGDRTRARVLAEQARDGWSAAGEAEASSLAEVESWLRRVDSRESEAHDE